MAFTTTPKARTRTRRPASTASFKGKAADECLADAVHGLFVFLYSRSSGDQQDGSSGLGIWLGPLILRTLGRVVEPPVADDGAGEVHGFGGAGVDIPGTRTRED